MSVALGIYNRLPARSRSIAASARGYYLSWWRYGRDTERFVDEAIERDSWDAGQWSKWQSERLQFVLDRARRHVPHYKALLTTRSDDAIPLVEWPVLTKDELRKDAISFVADDCRVSRMFHDHTSGTTGSSLDLWLTRGTVKRWYALFEARCRRWYGVSRHDRWAILGGQLVVPVSQQKPPFWVWNAGLNQLYLSSYHLSPELIDSYLDAIVRYRVTYILGYPSAMYRLALRALQLGRKDIRLKVSVTNA
jgi:phenylacetate-CoA ligase